MFSGSGETGGPGANDPVMPLGSMPAILVLLWVLTLCVKQWMHAWVAVRAGVSGARPLMRDALRPWRHEEPYITLGLPVVVLAMLGVGMSGPALSVDRLRMGARGKETAIYLAGPVFHAVLAVLFALPLMGTTLTPGGDPHDASAAMMSFPLLLCGALSTLNLEALVFTLIPLPPFDAYRAAIPWLPNDAQYFVNRPVAAGMMLVAAWFATDTQRGAALITIVMAHISGFVGLNPLYCFATFTVMLIYRWVAALTMLALFGLWYWVHQRR